MAERTILFVDDEQNILRALQRLFLDESYRVLTASGGQEALALLEEGERPALIVSDQRMPVMDGAEFLAKARELAPDSMRIMLTGYADIGAAIDAINRGGIYRYIAKPWDDAELKATVREAVERYELVQQNRQLTEELKDKNRELEELNASLEQLVEERTVELRQSLKELAGRDRIQQHLLTIHRLEKTLQIVLEVIVEVVGVASAVIHLPQPGDDRLMPAVAVDVAGPVPLAEVSRLAARRGLGEQLRQVMARREPVLLALGAEAGDAETRVGPPFAAVPILQGERCLGVLEVSARGDGRPLAQSDLDTIASFGMQAAIGIRDAQLQANLPELEASLDDVLLDFEDEAEG